MKEIKQVILNKIKEYDTIILSRHVRPDGDAVGSTEGLREILKSTYPQKEIYLVTEDSSDYLSFLDTHSDIIPDEKYQNALAIVLDTASQDRISNEKISLAKELIKIDHHIEISPYGDYSWVEEDRSSLCEMIVDFYRTFSDELKINTAAATYLYVGMVTDTGRFRFRSVTGETMRCAGLLLDQSVNIDYIYAHLNLDDCESIKFYSYVYKNMKITKHGVVSIYLSNATQKKFGLTREEASNVISLLNSFKNCIVWIAFIEYDEEIRVRIRSRFLEVNKLAEKYGGGGHACACGTFVADTRQIKAVIEDADKMVEKYKAENTGWL